MSADQLFVDRVEEREILDNVVDAARQGASAALVVHGEVGMGKTTLLDYVASAAGLPVARISGIEAEQAFGFAALHRLLLPFIDQVDMLPPPQRTALENAFGLLADNPPDLFMVGLAALTLLAAQSAGAGLLCVIDDAQWIDRESLQTLAFVGRRIRAEGIVILFGLRTQLEVPPDLAGIPAREVGGLPYEDAIRLLGHAAERPLAAAVARRIVDGMNGCPLALWELGKDLAEGRATDQDRVLEPLTISSRLEDHFFQQVTSLPAETQLLLLIAAVDTTGDRALVRTVGLALECGLDAQEEAERSRFLLPGPQIRFRHPLIRSAVYARADSEQRRVVHQALAEAIDKSAHPDLWGRHVALGASGPSERLATELEAMSERARARGGYSAQAALLAQAANLSESTPARSMRLLGAATAAVGAGMHSQAADLLGQAEPHLADPAAVAEAQRLRGQLWIQLFQPAKAPAALLAAARSFLPLSNQRAREVLLEAFEAYTMSADFTEGISPHDIASAVEETTPEAEARTLEDLLLDGSAALFTRGRAAAYEQYRRLGQLLRDGKITDQILKRGTFGALVMDEIFDDQAFAMWAERADGYARQSGALLALLFNLFSLEEVDVRAGRLGAAAGRQAEALDLAAAAGLPVDYFSHLDFTIWAWAGDEERTQSATAAVIAINTAIGSAQPVTNAHRALATLHLGAGRYREALEESDWVRAHSMIGIGSLTLPLAVEAATRAGEQAKAQDAFTELEARARASGTPWALGLLARSAALLAEAGEAEGFFEQAIGFLGQTSVTVDLVHTRLLYGEWLRREKRKADARAQLQQAHDRFTAMGAAGFARRAEMELLATGARIQPRPVRRETGLTPQERRVAELAAQGLKNMEIASALFISSATVDYHLQKVYRKLQVSSRVRLAKALQARDQAGGTDADLP
ncbi:MAG TPA: LuxR family transcriptional regulator [Trebonia sp.]|nr:LuxR family transcriptional regulator [Trebonia sp.]